MHLLYFFRIPTGLTAIAMPVQIIFHLCKNYLGIIWNYLVLISNTNVVIVKVRKHALKIYNQLTSTGSCKIPRLFFFILLLSPKELQKDVDKLKKRIRATILDEKIPVTLEVPNHYEATRKMFHDWMNLLDELLVPASHQVL